MQGLESQLGCSMLTLFLVAPTRPLVPPQAAPLFPQTSVWQKGSYHSVSQFGRNRESSLSGGSGTAEVTSRSLLYQQISLGNGHHAVFGEIRMVSAPGRLSYASCA